MSTNLASNIPWSGPTDHPTVAVVTQSAQDLYDAYYARVIADGAVVHDAAACLAAYQDAVNHKYLYQQAAAISPRWGVKIVGGNNTKLYNLVDATKDAIVTGIVEHNTTQKAWATAKFDNVADLITFTNLNIKKAANFGYTASTGGHLTVSEGLYATFTPAAEQWIYGEYDGLVSVAAVSKIDHDVPLADGDAVGVLLEQNENRLSIIVNGIRREIATNPWTALANNAIAPSFVIRRNGGTVYMNEFWIHNAPTVDGMIALGADMAARGY